MANPAAFGGAAYADGVLRGYSKFTAPVKTYRVLA